MLAFFLKVQNTQCGYHLSLSSLIDLLVPMMRRLRLEDLLWDREPCIWGYLQRLRDFLFLLRVPYRVPCRHS
jgi:hypothetical protein